MTGEGDLNARLARERRRARPGTLVIRGARVLDPLAGSRRRSRRRRARGRDRRARASPAAASLDGAEVIEAEGMTLLPAFFDPHVHLRTPGREDEEDLETGHRAPQRRAATAGSSRWRTPSRPSTPPPMSPLCASGPASRATVPVGFVGTVTKGMAGVELTEMSDLAARRRGRLLRRWPADRQRPGHAPRASVPAPGRPADRAARAGPRALRRRVDARGRGLGAARHRRLAVGRGVDDDRPRHLAGDVRGGADPRPAPLGVRVGRRPSSTPRPTGSRSPAKRPRTI